MRAQFTGRARATSKFHHYPFTTRAQFGGRARRFSTGSRFLAANLALAGILAVGGIAAAQMTVPTTGVVPSGFIDHSLILGDDLADFQAMWASPVNTVQQGWKNQINGAANGGITGVAPTSFSAAASQAGIAEAAGLRYAMTGSSADLAKVVSALLVADVPVPTSNAFIIRPEVVTSYLSAYDYIRGAPTSSLTSAQRAAIESRLLTLTTSLDYGNSTYSNARGKIGGTKALAGVLLQSQTLLDTGLSDLNGHFAYSTTDDGWFTDSPSHYLNYTLRHISLFARAYQQGSGVDLYPNLDPYIHMTMGLRMPDGSTPNVSNGLVQRTGVYALSQTTDPAAAGVAMWDLTAGSPANYDGYSGTNIFNNTSSPASFFSLINFADVVPTAPATSPTYLASGQSKVAVFRNDWTTSSDYLLLSAGIDSPPTTYTVSGLNLLVTAFHSHNDSAEILLASKGQYILVAPGYERTDLPHSPSNFTPTVSDWHNVVLVDGNLGRTVAYNTSPNLGKTRRPEDFLQTNRLDSTEFGSFKGASDFSSLETVYNGTNVRRSIAFPGEDYFVVADRMDASATHTYGFNLIGRGTRTVLTNTPGRMDVQWELNGSRVIEHLFSTHAMSLTTDTRWMHYGFDQFELTYRMLAQVSGEDALFLSVLETGYSGQPSALAITKLTTSADALAVLVNNAGSGWTDTILTQVGHSMQSAGDVTTDANYAYLRMIAGDMSAAMLAEGTTFSLAGELVFDLSNPTTLSLLFEPDLVLGTVSGDGLASETVLRLFHRGRITGAWLDGSPIGFANGVDYGTITLASAGELRVEFGAVPEASGLVLAGLAAAVTSIAVLRNRRVRTGRTYRPQYPVP